MLYYSHEKKIGRKKIPKSFTYNLKFQANFTIFCHAQKLFSSFVLTSSEKRDTFTFTFTPPPFGHTPRAPPGYMPGLSRFEFASP
jgi:hypothetical protein